MLLLILVIPLLFFAGLWYFLYGSPKLPQEALDLIKKVRESPLPELVKGKTGYAQSGTLRIWYEVINPMNDPKGTVLLVMGHATSAVRWSPYVYQPMIEAGYQVIRYDNRGLGKSDWIKNWTKKQAYSLADMAGDALAILDTVGIEKAHLFGVSMGGMIAQQLTIDHPSRVASLTSIMSSGFMYDPELPPVPKKTFVSAIKLAIRYRLRPNEENFMKYAASAVILLKGADPAPINFDFALTSNLYNWRKHNGYNSQVFDQHTEAIKKGGSRYEGLKKITVPTLVIHGERDPLVLVDHSRKYGPMIPGARVEIIEKMGHRLGEDYMPRISQLTLQNFAQAEVEKKQ